MILHFFPFFYSRFKQAVAFLKHRFVFWLCVCVLGPLFSLGLWAVVKRLKMYMWDLDITLLAAALTVVDTYLCVNYNGLEFAFILKHPSLTKAGVKELKSISFRTVSLFAQSQGIDYYCKYIYKHGLSVGIFCIYFFIFFQHFFLLKQNSFSRGKKKKNYQYWSWLLPKARQARLAASQWI